MIQTEAADDTARRTAIKPVTLVVSIIGVPPSPARPRGPGPAAWLSRPYP